MTQAYGEGDAAEFFPSSAVCFPYYCFPFLVNWLNTHTHHHERLGKGGFSLDP